MRRMPREYLQFDHRLRTGDYLEVAALRFPPGRRRLDEAFARIERVEHLTGPAVVADQNGVDVLGWDGEVRVAVFCHGMPGPVILRGGDHRVLAEVNPDRVANDERNLWWELDSKPLFHGAVFPGPSPRLSCTVRKVDADQDPVGWPSPDAAEPAVRRAASFVKPARALRVGDYLQVLAVRFPEHDRDTDEGFGRVEWIGYLDADYSGRLCDACWAGSLVTVRGLRGALLLPDRDVRVMVWPNPERAAVEPRGEWMGEPLVEIVGVREPTEAERAEADRLDEQLRPEPPAGEAELYPVTYTDEHERAMLFHGVDGIRTVPLAALPWPHRQFTCEHRERIRAIAKTYPDDDPAGGHTGQTATAEAFDELTAADFAACHYHRAGWANIGAIALEVVESGSEALEKIEGDERLGDEDRVWLASLFTDPICWDDGGGSLTNGQHRLCALRAAGVPACPVEGRYLPDASYLPPLEAAEHARRTVEQFWIAHLTARFGDSALVRRVARLLARRRRLRSWLPGSKRDDY